MIDIVTTIGDLRAFPTPSSGGLVYVRCHSALHFGGGGIFMFLQEYPDRADNDGTIIESNYATVGRWIRQFQGYLDVRFFGASGITQPGDGAKIQNAIDAAANNVHYSSSSKGSTVFIPSGNYMISAPLILKNGVSIVGDGMESTQLIADYTGEGSSNDGYMIKLDKGPVSGCHISDLRLVGGVVPEKSAGWDPSIVQTKTKGCMHLKAVADGSAGGGLWNSTFKNLHISQFNGPGIFLEGDTGYFQVHQGLVFENIIVRRQKDMSVGLRMENQIGQITFINAGFEGIPYKVDGRPCVILGQNVEIITEDIELAVISFINSTIQGSDVGVYIKNGESITFDTCWFESLNLAIVAEASTGGFCKGINIMNSRFANAGGFGSLEFANKSGEGGRVITSSNAEMNVINNLVKASDPNDLSLASKYFILSYSPNDGIHTLGNSFQSQAMGNTSGMNQVIIPGAGGIYSPDTIDLIDCNSVYVNSPDPALIISTIISSVCPGEIITIRANVNALSFDTAGNIFLSGQSGVTLNNGDIATFVKFESDSVHIYHLISIFKSTTVT